MFQYEWVDLKNYEPVDMQGIALCDPLKAFGVKAVRVAQWEEHCLECAPPECYGQCPFYSARMDKKCRRLDWGMTRVVLPGSMRDAIDIRFRKWGKLETQLYPGAVSPGKADQMDRSGEKLARGVASVSRSVHRLSPHMRLSGALVVFRRKFLRGYRKASNCSTPHFLLHVFSFEKKPFGLFLDVCLKDKVLVHRERFDIVPGENVCVVRLPENASKPEGYGLLRLYPEEGIYARLLVSFAGCVALDESRLPTMAPAKKVKCVVWDLDNTVWNGTLIESEDGTLALRDGVRETIEALDRRGILQSIASKNDHEPAMERLKQLGIDEYFLYPQIHWGAKSASLERIAQELNIDVNTFGFIDDSAFERAEVASKLPQVRLYTEEQITEMLLWPEMDVPATAESGKRRGMYRTEEKRRSVAQKYAAAEGGNLAFLRECELVLTIFRPVAEAHIARSVELIQRTNQLNLSGRKYTREEFETMLTDPTLRHYAMRCADRFGDYGQAVYLQLRETADEWIVTEFAMSCRIAQKCVENAMLQWMRRLSADEKAIRFEGVRTKKNGLLLNTLIEAGLEDASTGDELLLRLPRGKALNHADIVRVEEEGL